VAALNEYVNTKFIGRSAIFVEAHVVFVSPQPSITAPCRSMIYRGF